MAAMKVQPAPVTRPKQFKAYTIRRVPGGGWKMVTALVSENDVVDETDADTRDAMFTRIEDELRRMD